jgi:hypothetical protein
LGSSGGTQLADLEALGTKIKDSVKPPEDSAIVTSSLGFLENILAFTEETTGPAGKVLKLFTSAYELGNAIATTAQGEPIGDQINTKVGDLAHDLASNIAGTANAMDSIRLVIISNWGRLKQLGPVANQAPWVINAAGLSKALETSADAYFSSELLPVAYQAKVPRPAKSRWY